MVLMSENHSPVLDALESQMRCCMFSNAKGDVMIVHEKPLDSPIQWVEFYAATGVMNLVHEDGKTQPLGYAADEAACKNISNGQEVTLVHFDNGVVSSCQTTVMIMQED